jgi:ABC-type polysaccharide/polyol phosphate export permease
MTSSPAAAPASWTDRGSDAEPEGSGSRRPGWIAELREAATELWQARELIRELTLRDVRVRYKQATMGFGWALLMPVIVVFSGVMMRYGLSHTGGGAALAGVAGIATKALPWSFFVRSVSSATGSLTGNITLITKVYFPREALPLSATLAQVVDMAAALVVLVFVLPIAGVRPSLALAWVPLLLCLLFLLVTAASLALSCANLFFRDVRQVVQIVLTFGIFFTPVFFDAGALGPRGARLVMLNPLAPILEGLRLSVVDGHGLLHPLVTPAGVVAWEPWYLLYSAVWSLGGLGFAVVLFQRTQYLFAEYV